MLSYVSGRICIEISLVVKCGDAGGITGKFSVANASI